MLSFSSPSDKLGIVEQARGLARLDSVQFPTSKIVASCNNWLDTLTGYAIGADERYTWDNTQHTKLPIGTDDLISGQSDYSFLTDEQGNSIITLNRIELLRSDGVYVELQPIYERDIN